MRCAAALALFVAATTAHSASPKLRFVSPRGSYAGVTGCIYDSAGKLVIRAMVVFEGLGRECVDFTDIRGVYWIDGLKPGPYLMRVFHEAGSDAKIVYLDTDAWTRADATVAITPAPSSTQRSLRYRSAFFGEPWRCQGHWVYERAEHPPWPPPVHCQDL